MPTTAPAKHPYVETARNGTLFIRGTPYKLAIMVGYHLDCGWDATEMQKQFPRLTLAQTHGALAYYYDHQDEVDAIIEGRRKMTEEIMAHLPPSRVKAKLKKMKQAL